MTSIANKVKIGSSLAAMAFAIALTSPAIGNADPTEPDGIVTIVKDDGHESGWVSMDAIENRFDTLSPTAQAAANRAVPPDGVQMRNADGCNQNVCINVSGEDLTVYEWSTTAVQLGSFNCQEAFFQYPNGTYVGPYVCPDGIFYDTTGPTGFFEDNSALYNSWSDSNGRPCITVHD